MEEKLANSIIRIVIIGPESTGKTELTKALASAYHTVWIPEYARDYILKLNRPYTQKDVLHIAEVQRQMDAEFAARANQLLFIDTDLIITKVWLEIVYGYAPDWIREYLGSIHTDLYLLCKPDIPWVPDPVRENGGPMREILFERYRIEIEQIDSKYRFVSGTGITRLLHAISHIQSCFPDVPLVQPG